MVVKKNILITGGLGYIGAHVVNLLLKSNYKVTVVDKIMFGSSSLLSFLGSDNFEFFNFDIREDEKLNTLFKNKNFSAVIHLAALVGEAACKRNEDESKSINFDATISLAKKSKMFGVQNFIFMSTASSYGVQDINEIADEKTKVNPVSLYAITKINSEKELLDKFSEDLNITIFRPSTVHGVSPRMRFDLIVNHLTLDAFNDGNISVFGPKMWRPLMWVGEPARIFKIVLEADQKLIKSQIFNLGSDNENFQKIHIAECLKNNFFPKLNIQVTDKDPDLRSYRVSFQKIKETLKYETSKTLKDAISEILILLKNNNEIDTKSDIFRN
jgi:nucleoside-diphosphate-sugar epimerase